MKTIIIDTKHLGLLQTYNKTIRFWLSSQRSQVLPMLFIELCTWFGIKRVTIRRAVQQRTEGFLFLIQLNTIGYDQNRAETLETYYIYNARLNSLTCIVHWCRHCRRHVIKPQITHTYTRSQLEVLIYADWLAHGIRYRLRSPKRACIESYLGGRACNKCTHMRTPE